MKFHQKNYPFLIAAAVLAGPGAGQYDAVRETGAALVLPLLILMLFLTFLPIPLNRFFSSFLNLRFTISSLVMNFLWTPLLAWMLASLFLQGHPALWTGFIMLMVTSCTDWYVIFTGLAKGNTAISSAILPVNLLLQMILLPVYLYLFAGTQTEIEAGLLLESVITVLFLPLLTAIAAKGLLKNHPERRKKLFTVLEPLPVYLLALAIASMFASQARALTENAEYALLLLFPIMVFFAVNFLVGSNISSIMQFSFPDRVSFHMTTIARNSPLALAVAVSAFPDQPLIALTLVIGPLLELPVLAALTHLLNVIRRRTAAC
ncbi:arsenic resistance protein [Alkalicoccus halolimnae]|uniref:Bile acid:sodium symporter n=1 Tax=Alkalicoccus halolimnae TaxID=1667239 RepID=A0A5C7EZG7_9BACI|nr:bile acid:sodium symporter [Alkalicoccus halolimnae]TXF81683.1 arsenic resistance protein [Alkalicoccus halolimnae]